MQYMSVQYILYHISLYNFLLTEAASSVLVLRIDQVSDAPSKPDRPAKEPVAMTTEEFLHFNFYPCLGNAQQCVTV